MLHEHFIIKSLKKQLLKTCESSKFASALAHAKFSLQLLKYSNEN